MTYQCEPIKIHGSGDSKSITPNQWQRSRNVSNSKQSHKTESKCCCCCSTCKQCICASLKELCKQAVKEIRRQERCELYGIFDRGPGFKYEKLSPIDDKMLTASRQRLSKSQISGEKGRRNSIDRGQPTDLLKKKGITDEEEYDVKGKRKKKKSEEQSDDEDSAKKKKKKGKGKRDEEDDDEVDSKKKSKKGKGKKDEEEDDEVDSKKKSKKGKGKKGEEDDDDVESKKKSKKGKGKKGEEDDDEVESKKKSKKGKGKKGEEDDEEDSDKTKQKKGRGKKGQEDDEDDSIKKGKGKKEKDEDYTKTRRKSAEDMDGPSAKKKIGGKYGTSEEEELLGKIKFIKATRLDNIKVCDILRAQLEAREQIWKSPCRCNLRVINPKVNTVCYSTCRCYNSCPPPSYCCAVC